MKQGPWTFALTAVPWNVFGTLTFRREQSRVESAAASGLNWLSKVRLKIRRREEDFYFFLRVERGESLGRLHLHVLLWVPWSSVGWFVPGKGRVPAAHKCWGLGLTTFRLLDGLGDSAIPYTIKPDEFGGDVYEITKTSRSPNAIPSDALLRRVAQQACNRGAVSAALASPEAHLGKLSSAA